MASSHTDAEPLGPQAAQLPVARPGRAWFDAMSVRLCVGLSLLLVLLVWFDVNAIVAKLLDIDFGYLVLALLLFAAQFAVSCARWIIILGRQGSKVSARTALSIFGTGAIANLFLVTSVAGISVRAALLLRAGTGPSRALASLTAERLAATAGLALCAAAGFVFALPELKSFAGQWATPEAMAMITLALLFGVTGLAVLACKVAWLREFARTVTSVFATPGLAVQMVGASAAVVVLGFAGMAALAHGMGLSIDIMFFLSVMPAVAFLSALPISIGGWGVREGAMVAGLSIYSVPADSAMALSISYGLGGLLVALLLGTALAMLGQSKS